MRFLPLAPVLALLASCKEPPPPNRPPTPDATTTAPSGTATPTVENRPLPPPPPPAKGTRTTVANRANDDTWDKMLVAGGRLWVLTDVSKWKDGPMYVPAARLWSVPVTGGELTRHLELEGLGALAADASSIYVAVNRNLAKGAGRSGRIVRLPLAGGAPIDLAKGIEPRALGVDDDTIWFDEMRMPKDGSKPPTPSGVKGAMTFAFDEEHVYFTTPKGAGPAGDLSGARVFRMPKKGGAAVVLAAKLPAEAGGLAVDATHVYFCAVSWTSEAAERAGIVARVPKGGGDVEVIAKDQPAPRKLWLDAEDVFVHSGRGGRPATVIRVPKGGGEVTVAASDDTLEHAAMDATSLYLSSDGTFDPVSHARRTPASLVRVVVR